MSNKAGLKLTAWFLAVSLAGAPLPALAESSPLVSSKKMANSEAQSAPAESPGKTAVSLEEAIAIAKEKVSVPADLDSFKSEYYEDNGRGRWVFRWSKAGPPESNMQITVSAVTGELGGIGYYRSVAPGTHYNGLPAYSREQCLIIAREEAARLQPDRYPSTALATDGEQWQPSPTAGDREYPIVYSFNFRRTHTGIPVAEQGINVGISAETGELMTFDSNWDAEIKLPSPGGRISPGQAGKVFTEKAGLELTYFMPYSEDPDVPGDLKPVYRIKPPGRFVLNALTGEVIDSRDVDIFFDRMMGGGGMEMSYLRADSKTPIPLSPAENRAVKELKEFLSADQAQEAASRLVEIPGGHTVSGRSLERHYGVPGLRVWNISYQDKDGKNYIRVSVDARSGELISFSLDQGNRLEDMYKEPQVKVSEEEAKKTAGEFIKKMQPGKYGQVVFRQLESEMGPWIKMGKSAPSGYTINYARVTGGVVYPENGFRVTVNASTGKITYYEMNWWETRFPGVQGVLGVPAANEKFLEGHPITLEYAKAYKRWGGGKEPQYYLVYSPTGGTGVIMDAMSGQELDYQGKPVVKKGKPAFDDIAGHPAEKDILFLAGEGIIAGEGGKYRPDDQIIGAEALSMLVKAFGHRGPYYPLAAAKDSPWYRQVVDSAMGMGIIDKDFTVIPEAGLSRLQLSRLGINAGGWGKLAKISGIFKLDVEDAGKVPAEYRGYAAAAVGMGLVNPENGNFDPSREITRGEAATFLVRLMKQ
ncbi:MAG: YcdB/YcdC domain-containing protein [Desulfocucumaceae bacterium]